MKEEEVIYRHMEVVEMVMAVEVTCNNKKVVNVPVVVGIYRCKGVVEMAMVVEVTCNNKGVVNTSAVEGIYKRKEVVVVETDSNM